MPAKSGTRRRMAPDERREELLLAAADLFEDVPYDRLPMERIADACGTSIGLLYHYFSGKHELYVASVQHRLFELLDEVGDPGPPLSLEDRLKAGVDGYLEFASRHPKTYVALLTGGVGMDAEVHALLEHVREEMAARLLAALAVDKPSPRLRLGTFAWVGMVEAACTRWLREGKPGREEVVQYLVDSAFVLLTVTPGSGSEIARRMAERAGA